MRLPRSTSSSIVLVVEDEPDIRLLMRLSLEEAGIQIREAATGEEALAAIDKEAPQLMLLDLRLPDMTGWDVIGRMRAAGFEDMPVIVVSAHVTATTSGKMQELGCRGFIEKPFDPGDLVRVVGETLGIEQ
jgi:DNA-binding response OmpR family regulator